MTVGNGKRGDPSQVMRRGLGAAFAGMLLATSAAQAASAAPPGWIASWSASPAPAQEPAPGIRAGLVAPAFENQTIVQVVRLTAGGEALRIRFTNEYGPEPLEIRAARVSVLGADGRPGASQPVTFGAAASTIVPANAPMISDPVSLKTAPFSQVRIALYVGGRPKCTCHTFGLQPIEISPPGDFTDKPFVSVAPASASYRAFLSHVDVATTRRPIIVALGDSITDGVGSTMGADQRWPDLLARRLAATGPRPPAVINAGLGGNRLVTGDSLGFKGENALARLDRDVFSVAGVTHIVLLEGINDIGGGGATPPSAQTLIAGYRQVIARAHAHGIKVIGATLTPFLGSPKVIYYRPVGEAVRQQVNSWIRDSGAFDGVIDFDVAVRDPAAPQQMRANFHAGDWLHPNDAGYRAMADAIDLKLFR